VNKRLVAATHFYPVHSGMLLVVTMPVTVTLRADTVSLHAPILEIMRVVGSAVATSYRDWTLTVAVGLVVQGCSCGQILPLLSSRQMRRLLQRAVLRMSMTAHHTHASMVRAQTAQTFTRAAATPAGVAATALPTSTSASPCRA
jgi:hypothetical protein